MSKKAVTIAHGAAKGFGKIAGALSPLDLVRDFNEFRRVREQERTKRELIWAQRDILVTRFEYEREVFLTYLHRSFDERADALEKAYQVLDRGVTERNDHAIDQALEAIVGIIKVSPLLGYSEFRATFSHPSGTIEL
jgi:hypothetical protein